MLVDDLASQGARASADMLFTKLWNIPMSAPGLKLITADYSCRADDVAVIHKVFMAVNIVMMDNGKLHSRCFMIY